MTDIALVAQQASTGGWGYAVLLATWLKRVAPSNRVTLYCYSGQDVLDAAATLRDAGVETATIPIQPDGLPFKPFVPTGRFSYSFVNTLATQVRRVRHARRRMAAERRTIANARSTQRLLNRHDVVHFAWPYGIVPPDLSVPMTFIPHDFTYAHEFGVREEKPGFWRAQLGLHDAWLRRAQPIVSANFIAGELRHFFPSYSGQVPVIPLPCLLEPDFPEGTDDAVFQSVASRLGLPARYILCPNNTHPHKNLHALIGALWHIKRHHPDVKLLLTGTGTQSIRASVANPLYADRTIAQGDCDVLGLGLLSKNELVAVMRHALVTVNPSLCEAGSGSSADAWVSGSPVAMSDIPPFREQLERTGAMAALFDPHSPREIAEALLPLINDRRLAAEYAQKSRAAIGRSTWHDTAVSYLDVLVAVAQGKPVR